MHIEKIHDIIPGLYEIFLDSSLRDHTYTHYTKFCPQFVNAVYGETIAEYFSKYNISFSLRSRTVSEVLVSNDTTTRFEISARRLKQLPRKQQEMLCKKFKLLITDLYESGAELGEFLQASRLLSFADTIFIDSGANSTILDFQARSYATPDNCTLVHIPMYLYYTVSRYMYKDIVQTTNNLSNTVLVPCMKPHEHRITLLNALDRANILSTSNWSLKYDLGNVSKKSTLEYEYYTEYNSTTLNFIEKHKDMLPKFLADDYISYYSEEIMEIVHSNYSWHIIAETFDDRVDLSEKVFQAFMCMHPPLILAGTGYISALRQLGFKMSLEYEDCDTEQQIENIINIIKTMPPNLQEAEYNQQLCCDIDHWSNFFTKTLAEAAK